MNFRLLSRQAAATAGRHPQIQARAPAAEREVVRAEADVQRLRQAWLYLAKGEGNEVAMAMVGADMERANRSLQRLSDPRKPTLAHGRSQAPEHPANHFAEEGA